MDGFGSFALAPPLGCLALPVSSPGLFETAHRSQFVHLGELLLLREPVPLVGLGLEGLEVSNILELLLISELVELLLAHFVGKL